MSKLVWLVRVAGLALLPAGVAASVALTPPRDAAAGFTWCGITNDWGGAGGYGWTHHIIRYSTEWFCPGSTGQRGQAYDIWGDSDPTATLDMIDVQYMRYWTCGSLTQTYAPPAAYNVAGQGIWFGPTALNNCGWQADSYVEFYEAGLFDDFSYIDDP